MKFSQISLESKDNWIASIKWIGPIYLLWTKDLFGCADCQRGWHSDIDELFKNITWWGKVAKISNIRKIGKQGWNYLKFSKNKLDAKLSEVTSASLPWNGEF